MSIALPLDPTPVPESSFNEAAKSVPPAPLSAILPVVVRIIVPVTVADPATAIESVSVPVFSVRFVTLCAFVAPLMVMLSLPAAVRMFNVPTSRTNAVSIAKPSTVPET